MRFSIRFFNDLEHGFMVMIPEPASYRLLPTGCLALLRRRRRRLRQIAANHGYDSIFGA
jgi:hypothetical protein